MSSKVEKPTLLNAQNKDKTATLNLAMNHFTTNQRSSLLDLRLNDSAGFSSKIYSFVVNLKDSKFNRLSSKGWVEAKVKKMQGGGEEGVKTTGGGRGAFSFSPYFPLLASLSVGFYLTLYNKEGLFTVNCCFLHCALIVDLGTNVWSCTTPRATKIN